MKSGNQVRNRNKNKIANNDTISVQENNQQTYLDEFNSCLNEIQPDKNSYFLTRIVLIRFLAFIYCVAFLVALNQNQQLIGKNGLTPANKYMEKLSIQFEKKSKINEFKSSWDIFMKIPTIFWFFDWKNNIDNLLLNTSLFGFTLSILIMIIGSANSVIMFSLWISYHSIVNIGQTWYSFGWESQLLESGFIAIFLVPFFSLRQIDHNSPPSFVPILLYRWLIFRIMLGAGLIKIRGDACWKDFTCMNYHYETQPVPNPLSFYMHKTPEIFHKFEVLSNHFIELIVPFFIMMPFRSIRILGGLIQILFQVILILSGNLSFLNWLTILPSLATLDDRFLGYYFSRKESSSLKYLLRCQFLKIKPFSDLSKELLKRRNVIIKYLQQTINILVLILVTYLSYPVILNLLSRQQAMNTSYDAFRIVNTYGAFGSITKERNEVIFKGTQTNYLDKSKNVWLEYEFKCKIGSIKRTPCIITPYHYRLDWLLWFASFGRYEQHPWLLSLASKFLLNDKQFTSQMIAKNPFMNSKPPELIRIDLYSYQYAPLNSTHWWNRKYIGPYLPPVSFQQLEAFVADLDWDIKKLS